MAKCKLAVIRRGGGRFRTGEVVDAFTFETYLGKLVESVGGAYVIVEVNNADVNHPSIQKLIQPWEVANPAYIMGDTDAPKTIPHDTFMRRFYLRPQREGDPFFFELSTSGRVNESIEIVEAYTEERA